MTWNKENLNHEWYTDRTAGDAIRNKRKEDRMKKRSCRRTAEEQAAHEEAVKLRKMTDEQLVEYIKKGKEDSENHGYCRGLREGKKQAKQNNKNVIPPNKNVWNFLKTLEGIKGIGPGTVLKLRNHALKEGFIYEPKPRTESN